MSSILMIGGVVLVFVASVYGFYFLTTRLPQRTALRRVEQRLQEIGTPGEGRAVASGLIKADAGGPFPLIDRFVDRVLRGDHLARWIEQSGMRVSVSALLLTGAAIGALFGLVAVLLTPNLWIRVGAFLLGLMVPIVVVRHRRTKRLRQFEEQFPEALDLISRAVRAGHAFNTGLKMVADELPEPVGPEFRKTFDEQNFGLSLKEALNNLSVRIPLLDVRFFVTAVLIQRETGGNLSEILDNLGHVVRERFKILRQVRVYTAHGRFTGYVLLGLPAALAVVLMFINPEHMNLLFKERMGQMMLMGTLVMQVIGYFWIQKVIKIEV